MRYLANQMSYDAENLLGCARQGPLKDNIVI